MKFNIPTYLTLLRIVLIPVMIGVFFLPKPNAHVICAFIFMLAGITDWLDGYLARKLQMTTRFGAFLDPVADKLMVTIALVLIVEAYSSSIITVSSAVIVGREITIASLREWMAEVGERRKVAVSELGKWKTAAQMLSVTLLFLGLDIWSEHLRMAGQLLLSLSAALTLWSMIIYLRAAIPSLSRG